MQSEQLKILRELGFVPFTLAMHEGKVVELVSYPTEAQSVITGYYTIAIMIREPGQPTTMRQVSISDVYTALLFESYCESEKIRKFLTIMAPLLRTQSLIKETSGD